MSINKLLLWEKWRPKTIEDIILPPRIRDHFKNRLEGNYIFYGSYGTGKTSLSRILVGKYTKDKPFLEINISLYTSINVLRTEIENFCKFKPMMESDSDIKYVLLDEFDRASPEFQDAFKAFVEKYSKVGVRFLITTNHINKIEGGLKSRIPQLNFDISSPEEEKYLKQEMFKRIRDVIAPVEEIDITKEELASIVTKKFPDFRETIVELESYKKIGSSTTSNNISGNLRFKLYDMIYDKSIDYEGTYNFLMSNFGHEKIDVMISMLGRPFIDWSINNDKNIDKLFKCNYIISDYTQKLETNTDPIVLGLTIIGKLKEELL